MTLHFRLIDFGTPCFDESIALRDRILRKPLDLSFTIPQIEKEYDSYHLGAYNRDGVLVGCLVLLPLENEIKMRQVAVDADIQSRGIGTQLVAYSEEVAKALGFKKMVLHARDTAIPFYRKINYKTTGKAFTEVGIKHFKMYKKLG